MKKLIYSLTIALLLWGCTDLNDAVEDGIGEKVTEGRPAPIDNPEAALVGVYSQRNGLTDQANTWALWEHSSDELMGPTRGTDWSDFGVWRQLHAHQWDATHSYVVAAWNQLNEGIFEATQVIDAPSATDQTIAEARFLRAFFTFHVMDLYGQVPFRPSDALLTDVPEVMSRADAFQFIVEDLEAARPNLPTLTTGADAGEATQEAADFLLAKLFLNRAVYTASSSDNPSAGPFTFDPADMDRVVAAVENLEANAYLDLTDYYYDNFHWENTTRSTELVFTIRNEAGDPADRSVRNRYYMTLHYNQTPSSWNGFTTIADFYAKFTDEGDVRKSDSVPGMTDEIGLMGGFLEGQQYDGDGTPLTDRGGAPLVFTQDVDLLYSNERMGVRAIKYLVNPANPEIENPGTDYIFFRYADALLMKAEAHFRKGETGPALTIINDIRTQRGAQPLTGIDEQAILDERGFELYWEGWRRNDQIRFGQFTNAWNEKEASDLYRVLFPIPQSALDTNPNLIQNSGY